VNTETIDVFNAKFTKLIDFDDKVFFNKNENLIFDIKELEKLDEIHDVKAENKEQSQAQQGEMISLKAYEEEKQAFMIYGATVAALALVLVVAAGKILF